jgi:hypothetical protein
MADRYNGSSTGTSKLTASRLHRPTNNSTFKRPFNIAVPLGKQNVP